MRTATGRIILNFFDYQGGSPEVDDLYVTYSDTDGASWITPFTVNQYAQYTCGSGTILQHSSGIVLMTFYGLNVGGTFPPSLIGVTRSTNYGTSWGAGISMGAGAQPSGETCLVELPNGTIRAFTRQDVVSPGPIYWADSPDVGLTWGSWTALPWNTIPGRPSCLLTSPSNFITLFYRRTGDGGAAYRYSADLGATWSQEFLVDALSSMYAGGCQLGGAHNGTGYVVSLEQSVSDCKTIYVTTATT